MLARNTEDLEKRLHVQQQGNSSDLNTQNATTGEAKEDALCDSKRDCTCPVSEEPGDMGGSKTDPFNE